MTNSRFLYSSYTLHAISVFTRTVRRVSWFLFRKPIQIGKFSYDPPKVVMMTNTYRLAIGKFCSISSDVKIIVDANHRTEWVSTFPFGEHIHGLPRNPRYPSGRGEIITGNDVWLAGRGDMTIGNDVWIGKRVLILPGVQIGDGAVIGAGSVVTKNVGDYEIVGGVPTRHIRNRFTDEQITELKRIKWWDWPLDKIKANYQLLQSSNIDEFIEKFRGEIPVKASSLA